MLKHLLVLLYAISATLSWIAAESFTSTATCNGSISCPAGELWSCNKSEAILEFKRKVHTNVWPAFNFNPYENQTEASIEEIQQVIDDEHRVCAIQYTDETKSMYVIRDFPSKTQALQAGFIVTHQGKCGVCSNLQDLAIILEKAHLTAPLRSCAFRVMVSEAWAWSCIKDMGFTDRCTDVQLHNILNTHKLCSAKCLWAWITQQPYNNPDGSLNDCLQCDEDMSGLVYKFFSGRNRRNSGIVSAIQRPGKEMYIMDHCYY